MVRTKRTVRKDWDSIETVLSLACLDCTTKSQKTGEFEPLSVKLLRCSCHSRQPSLSHSNEDLVKLFKELEDARAQIRDLESEREALRNLAEAAEIHCHFINNVLQDMRRKLGSTRQKENEQELNTMSDILSGDETSTELRQPEEEEDWQRRLETMQKKAREASESKHQQGKQDEPAVFSGALHLKTREELSCIAASLRLDVQGTVAVLVKRIKSFLEANPAIKHFERYVRLGLDGPPLLKRDRPIDINNSAYSLPRFCRKRPRNLSPTSFASS